MRRTATRIVAAQSTVRLVSSIAPSPPQLSCFGRGGWPRTGPLHAPCRPALPSPNSAPITGRFALANLNWLRVVTAAVYHVKEDGWEKISADDSGMKMHYKYAEEGFGVKY